MEHCFFSKFIFTKWQFTIIIKIHKLFHIYSFYFLFITHQVAQRQSAELVSQGSQVLISLLTKTFFSKINLKNYSEDFKNVKQFFLKKKQKKKLQDFFEDLKKMIFEIDLQYGEKYMQRHL